MENDNPPPYSAVCYIRQCHLSSQPQPSAREIHPATREGYRPPSKPGQRASSQPDHDLDELHPQRNSQSDGSYSHLGCYRVRYEPGNVEPQVQGYVAPAGGYTESAGVLMQPPPPQGPIHATIQVGGRDAESKKEWIENESCTAITISCCITIFCPVVCTISLMAFIYAVMARNDVDQERAIHRINASKRLNMAALVTVVILAFIALAVGLPLVL